MKLNLTIDGVEQQIEILDPAPACRFRLGDGVERAADVAVAAAGVYSILLDGRSYDLHVERTPRNLIVTVAGYRFEIEVRDPRRWSGTSARHGASDVEMVVAPMPGKVVRVLAAVGESVAPGQGLLVVEAMKMQNEMKSTRAGRLLSMTASEGATVTAGEVLATIGQENATV